MKSHCSSDRRCYRTSCETCAWRYSLNISRRIHATDPSRLFAVTIAPDLAAQTNFQSWRIQVRNLVDYRRQKSTWWPGLGLWGWQSSDNLVRGIISPGSVLEDEFLTVFGRRWQTTLRRIEVQDVRSEVYFAIRPGINFDTGPHYGRYQRIRLVIEPSGKVRLRAQTEEQRGSSPEDDAMAVVL